MDIVYIRDLRVETTIGINDFERAIKQHVSIDLEMAADTAKAAQSGAIGDALNYADVAARVESLVRASKDGLVESLAERIAATVMSEFGVPWLRLRLGKPGAVTGAREVGLVIERGLRP